ncbi:MAG: 2OG-Fe(II) oxygenase [Legionella sp.]|uniref:2OG-Fe(II) oxygenase n=1 Tax=Legionella sp. TaxID=459 RepID=UPI00284BDA80|nr:2OG-Fe(II) oxygenase [Legionella sp.]
MFELIDKINNIDWQAVGSDMNNYGYSIIPEFLNKELCQYLINNFDNTTGYRKTVIMERYRFGIGSYKYWDYPLPDLVQMLREEIYPRLVPIANLWMNRLQIQKKFPQTFEEMQLACHQHGQLKPTPLILQYKEGGYNTLHQDLYGEVYFPIQAACFLSDPGTDYTGGEFVMTEQIPRCQSRAIVLKPGIGDMILFTTNFRPAKGIKGYYRINMRHGVSEVQGGRRYSMGVIFHDAVS